MMGRKRIFSNDEDDRDDKKENKVYSGIIGSSHISKANTGCRPLRTTPSLWGWIKVKTRDEAG
jgi:hypothetical protein